MLYWRRADQPAIRTLKRTRTKGGVGELQVAVVGRGNVDALRNLPQPLDRRIQRLLGPPQGAQAWCSATPFVPPRFVKRRGLLAADNVEVLKDKSIALRHFVRVRHHGGSAPLCDMGYALRMQLAEPATGPIGRGYGCHFGLGLFCPADEQRNQE